MSIDISMGFKRNPFSKKSSEEELEFLDEIFFQPNYYSTLYDDLYNGNTRFIIGQRGYGKSSIINKLYKDLESDNSILVCKIDRFNSINNYDNEVDFLIEIAKKIITKVSINLCFNKKLIKKLNKADKEKLKFFIESFYTSVSKSEYEDTHNRIINFKRKNKALWIFNKILTPIFNRSINALVSISSDFVSKTLKLDSVVVSNSQVDYIKEINYLKYNNELLTKDKVTISQMKDIFDDIFDILKKFELNRTVVLFDKIDEFTDLQQEVNKIKNFLKDFLADTEFLMNENISIGFSLWSELKSELTMVRFDKFGLIDISWLEGNMEELLNKRLQYFSIGVTKKFNDLIKNETDKNEIIKLCNKSPRDLITIFYEIYLEQSNRNPNVTFFEDNSVRKGLNNFCLKYSWNLMFSFKNREAGVKELKANINKLLKLKLTTFNKSILKSNLGISETAADDLIKYLLKYNLIILSPINSSSSSPEYDVFDPKINYMIRHLIEYIE